MIRIKRDSALYALIVVTPVCDSLKCEKIGDALANSNLLNCLLDATKNL